MTDQNRLGDAPIEDAHRKRMNELAHFLDEYFNGEGVAPGNGKVGFVLMVFDFGDKGRCNYISNARREDVVVLLKEQLARFEGQPEIVGRA